MEETIDNSFVRRAKILRLRTNKLNEAYKLMNFDLTKKLLLDVELELSELEVEGVEEIPVTDIPIVTEIMSASKATVDSVNKAICFASGMHSQVGTSGASLSDPTDSSYEYEDVKLRFKPFSFDGEIRNWHEFWDRFNIQIMSRRRLSKITKFTFLLECLRGKALEVIKGLSITESNFDAAIERLTERYNNPERLVSSYYEELKDIEESDDSSSQRSNYDSIQKILKNLEAVGIRIDQDYLRTIVMSKFSRDTLRGALKDVKRSSDNIYSVMDLMVAIDSTLKIEEDIDIALKTRPTKKKSEKITTGTFIGGASASSKGKKFSNNSGGGSSGGGPIRHPRKQKECIYCVSDTHNSHDCTRFGTLSRRRSILSKKGLCFVCVKKHVQSICPDLETKCPNCHKPGHCLATCITHMIAMNNKRKKEREESTNVDKASSSSNNSSNLGEKSGTFLQTFICRVSNPRVANSSLLIRGLLDPGSQRSYINENLCRKLKVKPILSNSISCFHFGSSESYEIDTHECNITVQNLDGNGRTYTFTSTPCITGAFRTSPSSSFAESVLPKNLKLADSDIFAINQRTIDILIGGNLYNQFVDLTKTKKLSNGLLLLHSFFGSVPFGSVNQTFETTSAFVVGTCSEPTVEAIQNLDVNSDFANLSNLSCIGALEMIGIKSSELDSEHDKAVENHHRTVTIADNRVICCWPWRHENPNLASNYRVARARLRSLVSSLSSENLKKYNDIFTDYFEKHILEPAPKDSPYLKHYLAHRGVQEKNKIRPVFDGSAVTSTGFSINSLIYKGPPLQENIIKLLLNFRLNAVGVTADIEKAFLQLGLNEVDRDVCRLLWIKDLSKPAEGDNIIHLRFARVPFGVNASPFLLNIVIQEHLSSGTPNEWHLITKERFYVDNLVISVPDSQSAINLFNSVFYKFKEISMNLRDWASNDVNFINSLPQDKVDKKDGLISILGILWDRKSDFLYVKMNTECPSEPNKRNALKFLASIFDPLGFFGPSTLKLKVFLQNCWKIKYDWSERLPKLMEAELMKLRSELSEIKSISISRRIWKFDNKLGKISLHVFCDASKLAFACCAYLVYYNAQTCHSASTLIISKVRTSPIKPISIPKLELLGVLIGKRVAVYLQGVLDITLDQVVLWTDATTVLQWLNSQCVLPQFIHNRISEIKRTNGISIRHISGKENPADIATRGESPQMLQQNKLWWNGPTWITCQDLWPKPPLNTGFFSNISSEEAAVLCSGTFVNNLLTNDIEKRFSSWEKRIRIYFVVLKFAQNLLHKIRGENSILSDNVELRIQAEKLLIRELQKKYCGKEYKILLKAKLDFLDQDLPVPEAFRIKSDLDLFMDENLLLRCRGRLQNTSFEWDALHPILMPRQGEIARSYIRHLHLISHHIGATHLVSKIREKYWIPKCRTLIKSVLFRCVGCRRWTGGSYRLPNMPPLPLERVEEASPFTNIGIDYMGPIKIKSGDSNQKVYVVIFACLVTRAIHLEIARDTTAAEFLRTFMRFVSIRGSPKFIITDNASNFTFVQPLVADKVNITNRGILDYCCTNDIRWKFIPQYSPWQGGAYERLIGIVKLCLRKSYYQYLLDYVDLLTALYSIADTINSRPLTFVSSDEISAALTPNHFLRLRSSGDANRTTVVRNLRTDYTGRKVREVWTHITGVIENYWNVFQKHYLSLLRESHVVSHRSTRGSLNFIPNTNEVVLVKELGEPRNTWKLGKIVSLDSRNAVAVVHCSGSNLTRSINHLYPLEMPSETTSN